MNKRNSIIILAKNINMDKEYQNVIDYHEGDIVSLCRSNDHLVAEQNNYSFLRIGENQINVGIPYQTCLQANYIAMQNPYYSNKWFFAFIDRVEYNSELSTNIFYTVDEISTWWDYWQEKTCFVEREHVNDDTVGLHTVSEGLDTGEYIVNSSEHTVFDDYSYLIQYIGTEDSPAPSDATNVNGLSQPGTFWACLDYTEFTRATASINANGQQVLNGYLVPRYLLDYDLNGIWPGKDTPIYTSKVVTKPSNLDTYVPKNNKLKCFPYQYLLETNNNGGANVFHYELFPNDPSFSIGGCATVGGSIVSIPNGYLGGDEPNMLVAGKFPTCAWNTDSYTNWLTQQGINIGGLKLDAKEFGFATGIAKSVLGVGAGLLGGGMIGAGMISSGVSDIADTIITDYQYSKIPPAYHGNINAGDFLTASHKNGYYFYRMSVKRERAKIIDDYFTRFGYKVTAVKTPNLTGRAYFNFVKIGSGEIIGVSNNTINIPESSMDTINNVFRKGVTIWHNHDNIGNFNLDNSIVE